MLSSNLHRLSLLLCTALLTPIAFAQARPDTRLPANMPTAQELKHPPASWIDKDTGHRIVRLTNEPG
ncbi:MAG TPA: oligogalacturonate lyase, partial [Acidobacteriaceae bacterium]